MRVVRVLDSDGAATVHLAELPSGEPALLTVGHRPLPAPEQAAFLGWAERLARIASHPHIVDVAGWGIGPDARPFLAVQVAEHTLAEGLRDRGALSADRARALGLALSDALAATHAGGLVHGAIRPATVGLSSTGAPLLAGLDAGAPSFAQPLALTAYTTPEHLAAATSGAVAASAPADVYALAVTMYAALGGRLPWAAEDGSGLTDPALRAAPPPDVPGVPPDLLNVLRTALATSPAARPTAAALRDMLAAVRAAGAAGVTPIQALPVAGALVAGAGLRPIAEAVSGALAGAAPLAPATGGVVGGGVVGSGVVGSGAASSGVLGTGAGTVATVGGGLGAAKLAGIAGVVAAVVAGGTAATYYATRPESPRSAAVNKTAVRTVDYANATYSGGCILEEEPGAIRPGRVQLRNGRARTNVIEVEFVQRQILSLSGDGFEQAFVTIRCGRSTGPTDTQIHVFAAPDGRPREIGVIAPSVGEQVRAELRGGLLRTEARFYRGDEARCCPALRTVEWWMLSGDRVLQVGAGPDPPAMPRQRAPARERTARGLALVRYVGSCHTAPTAAGVAVAEREVVVPLADFLPFRDDIRPQVNVQGPGGVWTPVTQVRLDPRRNLALLSLRDPVGLQPLQLAERQPAGGAPLVIWLPEQPALFGTAGAGGQSAETRDGVRAPDQVRIEQVPPNGRFVRSVETGPIEGPNNIRPPGVAADADGRPIGLAFGLDGNAAMFAPLTSDRIAALRGLAPRVWDQNLC